MHSILSTATSLLLALLVLTTISTSQVEASFPANISSYFNVQIPNNLHVHNVSGGMYHHTARFGSHWDNWEGNLVAQLYPISLTLCQYPNETQIERQLPASGSGPFFLLVRNDAACSPQAKVRRAQMLGAAGVVLHHEEEGDKLPYLPDRDGSGKDISIPSVIITKAHAQNITDEWKKTKVVVVELSWHWPKKDPSKNEKVRLDFWHTPVDHHTQTFLSNMSFIVSQMEDTLDFNPHFFLLNGTTLNCYKHAEPNETCYPMCSNNGRYCSWGVHDITGHQVIAETLRRKCIDKHYPKLFWNYVDLFQHKCGDYNKNGADYWDNPDCLNDVYQHAGIDADQVDECMKDSGGLTEDNTNSMLNEELEWSTVVSQTPNLWINWVPYRWGPLDVKWVLEMACHGYVYGKAPHICHVCAHCGDPAACASRNPMKCDASDGVEPEYKPSKGSSGKKKSKTHHFFLHFFFFVLLAGAVAAGYVYYKNHYMDGDGSIGNGMGYQNIGMALMSDRT